MVKRKTISDQIIEEVFESLDEMVIKTEKEASLLENEGDLIPLDGLSRPEGSSVLSDFDLTASELRVDSSDVGVVEALVEAYNFKDCGRVFVGDRELVIFRK